MAEIGKLIFDIVIVALYFGVLVWTVVQAFLRWKRFGVHWKSVTTFFYVTFAMFLAFRISWQISENIMYDELAGFILNRIAFIFFLCAYNNTLFFWIDTIQSTMNIMFSEQAVRGELSWRFMSKRMFMALWGTSAAIIAFTIVCIVVIIKIGYSHTGNMVYDANILVIAGIFLVYSICFLVFGLRLYFRLKSRSNKGENLLLVGVTPVIIFLCFLYRFFLFLWRPVTNSHLPYGFYLSGYFVSELIPSVVFLYLLSKPPITSSSPMERKGDSVLDGLVNDQTSLLGEDYEEDILSPPTSPFTNRHKYTR